MSCGAADFQGHESKSPGTFCLLKASTSIQRKILATRNEAVGLPGTKLWAIGSSSLPTCSPSLWVVGIKQVKLP